MIKGMLCQAVSNYTADELHIAYFDLKKVSVNLYRHLPHLKYKGTNLAENIAGFEAIQKVIGEREELFAANDVENLIELQEKTGMLMVV